MDRYERGQARNLKPNNKTIAKTHTRLKTSLKNEFQKKRTSNLDRQNKMPSKEILKTFLNRTEGRSKKKQKKNGI